MDGNRMILRALKGAPVSVVLALMMAPGAMGVTELEGWTGYSDKPVRAALRVLAELGLAQRHSHRHGWMLTAHGRQMVLGEGPNPEILRIQPGSSGSSSNIEGDRSTRETTTTTGANPENFRVQKPELLERFGQRWLDVADGVLSGLCGIGRARARSVCMVAAEEGRFPGRVASEALVWLAYTRDEERATINNPAAFISARVEDGTRPPSGYYPPRDYPLLSKVRELKRQGIAEEEADGWREPAEDMSF